MIALESHSQGVILPVRAQPGARRNELRGSQNGALKVCVTQAAEKGKANKAVIEVLRDALDLRKSQVDLLSGETSQQKKFLIRGIASETLQARIAAALTARK